MSFSIDGVTWDIPCTIQRASEVTPSNISGMLLNKQYFNDVLGTWMKYNVTIAVPRGHEDDYSEIYEILSAPKDAHQFVLPYNQATITVTARVQTVSDQYVRLPGGDQTWRKTSFDIIANHPSKTMTLGEVTSVGLTPIPDVPAPIVGDLFEYTVGGWVQRFYENADEIQY